MLVFFFLEQSVPSKTRASHVSYLCCSVGGAGAVHAQQDERRRLPAGHGAALAPRAVRARIGALARARRGWRRAAVRRGRGAQLERRARARHRPALLVAPDAFTLRFHIPNETALLAVALPPLLSAAAGRGRRSRSDIFDETVTPPRPDPNFDLPVHKSLKKLGGSS